MTELVRIDTYTDENKIPINPRMAKFRYITLFTDPKTHIVEVSDEGFDIKGNKSSRLYYDGDKTPPLMKNEETATEEGGNPNHDKSTGQFTSGSGDNSGKINDYKNKLRDRTQPNKEVRAIQKEVDEEITGKIWTLINQFGLKDKVKEVAMQGSYEKNTDLPTSGSDLDIFIVFNTDVPDKEREELGIKIGMGALTGKNPYLQDATTKYAEAYFEHKGQKMEVQIVPTRHLTLDQIKNKELNGDTISIGMERTPHQTKFMKVALKGKEGEVRMLKQFMKDTGLYDSSMKSQGFSGYASEVLIHNLDTFENVLKYFADFKKGDVIGGDKGNKDNAFSLIDPIDPNRDLISAFSDMKIGRTIKTAQHFLEHGEPPKASEPVEMDAVSLVYNTTQFNEDTLVGQVRKTQKSMVNQLKRMGFNIESKEEKITDDYSVNVPRTAMNKEEGESKVELTFGINNLEIPETYKDKGVPKNMEKAVTQYKQANQDAKFVEEDGRIKAIKKRPFTHLADALKWLSTSDSDVQKTSVIDDMKNGVQTNTRKYKFENLI
jgi:tRNA nucleotidyltransferase (CCA-adding enzyme)